MSSDAAVSSFYRSTFQHLINVCSFWYLQAFKIKWWMLCNLIRKLSVNLNMHIQWSVNISINWVLLHHSWEYECSLSHVKYWMNFVDHSICCAPDSVHTSMTKTTSQFIYAQSILEILSVSVQIVHNNLCTIHANRYSTRWTPRLALQWNALNWNCGLTQFYNSRKSLQVGHFQKKNESISYNHFK